MISGNVRRNLCAALACLALLCSGCQGDDADDTQADDDASDDDASDDDASDDDVPGDVIDPPDRLPFNIERDQVGVAPTERQIADFTAAMREFFVGRDYFRWAIRNSFGLAEDNPWGQPPYMIWWTNAYANRSGDLVTFRFHEAPDNTTAKVTRMLGASISLYLTTGDESARELTLGYIRGLSATYDGAIWGSEDPVVDNVMARTIFHRDHQYALDGGRRAAVVYDDVRHEEIARRHDTLHNPENPTWGDIWVRNKRSKDDFPYLYRDVPLLARLIRNTDDAELKQAALKLYRQIRSMARSIVDMDYVILTKVQDGELYIPVTELGLIDDYACFTQYDWILPQAECDPKLCTAYLGYDEKLDNECGDGDAGLYEIFAILTRFWPSNMIWGFHLSATSLALAWRDDATALGLLYGLADRMDRQMVHPWAAKYVEWYPDMAQLLVLAAAYGLPLTNQEAQLVIRHYAEAAQYYGAFEPWDLWAAGLPDGDYEYLPDRVVYDEAGNSIKAYVRITEIGNLYEYCYSPLKDPNGAQFVDCAALTAER